MDRVDAFAHKLALSFPISLIAAGLGGWDVLAQVMLGTITLDIVAGLLRAWYERRLNSGVMRKGIFRKCGYFVAVLLAVLLDRSIFHAAPAFRTMVMSYVVINESLSILEHLSLMGVPLPNELKTALLKLRDKEKGSE